MKKENVPGWVLMAVLAVVATLLASQAKGLLEALLGQLEKNPVEKALLAILIGVALRNLGLLPKLVEAGIKAYENSNGGFDCGHLAAGGIQACNGDPECEAHQALMWTGYLPDRRALPSVVDFLAVATAGNWQDLDLPRKYSLGSGDWDAPGTWIVAMEFRIDGGAWIAAQPTDGTFNEPS